MKIICGWCNKVIGEKPGSGMTHGICDECSDRIVFNSYLFHFNQKPFIHDKIMVVRTYNRQFIYRYNQMGTVLDLPYPNWITVRFQDGEVINIPMNIVTKLTGGLK